MASASVPPPGSGSGSSAGALLPLRPAADLEADRQQSHRQALRLRNAAFQRNLVSRRPIGDQDNMKRGRVPLALQQPISADLVQKSTRTAGKRKFVFLMPWRISCKASGKQIGQIHGMSTRNPVMYIDFKQVRREGTHIGAMIAARISCCIVDC
jgi:hypothetical protein